MNLTLTPVLVLEMSLLKYMFMHSWVEMMSWVGVAPHWSRISGALVSQPSLKVTVS